MKRSERGFSLVEGMIAILFFAGASAALARTMAGNAKMQNTIQSVDNLQMVKAAVRAQMDCRASLGVNNATVLPLPCTGQAITLKRVNGSVMQNPIGNWSYTARCEPATNSIVVSAASVQPDPTLKKIVQHDDLWEGNSRLCSSFFGMYPCPQGEQITGYVGGEPICGRGSAPVNVPIKRYMFSGGDYCRGCNNGQCGPPDKNYLFIEGNVSPDDWCKAKGYRAAAAGCWAKDGYGRDYFGNLSSHQDCAPNGTPWWMAACMLGSSLHNAPKEIMCY